MKINDLISKLDTKRFGFKVAKVNHFDKKSEKLLIALKKQGVKLILSKVNAEDITLINTLEELGFCIKDIQVTYKYDLTDYTPKNISFDSDFMIRDAGKSDIPKLKKVALESFKNYGHYFEDKKLDPIKCAGIYSDWIERSCKDKNIADKIIVAEHKGDIAGFLSFKIYNDNTYKYAAGGLGSVAEKYRNKDIFRMIMVAGLNWGKEMKLHWEEHNVIITNFPVNRSMSKLGFKVYKSFVTMHHWIKKK
ncbi:MAG: hypothetical protein HY840_12200 [Bacteroidetes bacterium]|nr:hypothetical protein [Bacteroidota bacterium]